MSEESSVPNNYEDSNGEVELHNSISTVNFRKKEAVQECISIEPLGNDESSYATKDKETPSNCVHSSVASASGVMYSVINELDEVYSTDTCDSSHSSESTKEPTSSECDIQKGEEYSRLCKAKRMSLQSTSTIQSFYSDCCLNEISAPTSDDFLGCYSSPNSSLQSICGYTLNSVTKSRRYGRRYDPSVLSDMIRDPSYLSCSSIEGFRQQSEPALLHPEDKVSPALLRSGSQPALTSSQELPVLSLLQLNHCVPVERVDEPSQSTVSKSPQKPLPPGENNPDAYLGANLCFDYMNLGICKRQEAGKVCHFRHLDSNHPDVIANRFFNHLLTEEEIEEYQLHPCEEHECNPFAPKNSKICFDYLNKRICSRNSMMKICRYRHLLPSHPEAIADKNRRK